MKELGQIVQDVCLFGHATNYNCHHLVPHQKQHGCLRPYSPNYNQLLTFDETSLSLLTVSEF